MRIKGLIAHRRRIPEFHHFGKVGITVKKGTWFNLPQRLALNTDNALLALLATKVPTPFKIDIV